MTAKATEDRQYRYFDHYLTEKLASRLVRVNVATRELTDLTPGFDRWFQADGTMSYDLSPDGTQLVVVMNSTPPPYREFLNSDLFLIPTDGSGSRKSLTADNPGRDASAVFAPDGRSIYYLRTETAYHNGESAKLWRHDLAAATNTPLAEALDYSFDQVAVASDGRTLWLRAEDKGLVPVFRMNECRWDGPDGGLSERHLRPTGGARWPGCFSQQQPRPSR